MDTTVLQKELTVDNLIRRYLLHIPPGYDPGKPTPVVLAFHGRFSTGREMEKLTNLSELADKQGFIVVYPNGYGRSWNAGHGTGEAEARGVNDVKFTVELINSLCQTLNIDRHRLYATGFSNGATFVHRLACELSERIAAIAAVAGTIAPQIAKTCHPARPVAVVQIHGTADQIVPWEGGFTGGGGFVASAAKTVEGWVVRNGCAARREEADLGGGVSCISYSSCPQGGLGVVLGKLGRIQTLLLTSEDGTLAHLAARDLKESGLKLEILVLDGGTTAWIKNGLPTREGMEHALSEVEDAWYMPYMHPDAPEEAKRGYFAWEYGLVAQIERDGTAKFRKFSDQ
jgi:polyhydroxybutyrate depolymerase